MNSVPSPSKRRAVRNQPASSIPSPCKGEDQGEGPYTARIFRARFKIPLLLPSYAGITHNPPVSESTKLSVPIQRAIIRVIQDSAPVLETHLNATQSPLFLLPRMSRSPNRRSEIRMLGNQEPSPERKTKPLHLLHESKQPRQLAGQYDIFLSASARTRKREHADRFRDHVHDRKRLVLRRSVGTYLPEVRGGGGWRQVADRSAGDVANTEIDSPQ